MAKEAYYFSHDSNARHDPDIKAMRSVYGIVGYAWFWVLVEMMRDADEHKLSMQGKYIWNAYASELECNAEQAKQFVEDCIHEFNLFASDGAFFWSASLVRRMEKKAKTSEKRSAAANARWGKEPASTEVIADAMQMHSNEDANAMQGKESKVNKKESKEKEKKVNTAFEAYSSNPALLDTLYSFLEFRKSIKKPMGDKAITLLLGNLDKFATNDNDKIAILEQSILNGWQGIFALKEQATAGGSRGGSQGGRRGDKQYIPIIEERAGESVSQAELDELRKLARKLDGKSD